MKSEWLERGFLHLPYFKLILSKKEWIRETGRKDIDWISEGADATTHLFDNDDEDIGKILVCIMPHIEAKADFTNWLGLLVHEISHFIDDTELPIGVDNSGEVKAYATQMCFLQLLWDYERQMKGKTRFYKRKGSK